jgi:hypothetical protein
MLLFYYRLGFYYFLGSCWISITLTVLTEVVLTNPYICQFKQVWCPLTQQRSKVRLPNFFLQVYLCCIMTWKNHKNYTTCWSHMEWHSILISQQAPDFIALWNELQQIFCVRLRKLISILWVLSIVPGLNWGPKKQSYKLLVGKASCSPHR